MEISWGSCLRSGSLMLAFVSRKPHFPSLLLNPFLSSNQQHSQQTLFCFTNLLSFLQISREPLPVCTRSAHCSPCRQSSIEFSCSFFHNRVFFSCRWRTKKDQRWHKKHRWCREEPILAWLLSCNQGRSAWISSAMFTPFSFPLWYRLTNSVHSRPSFGRENACNKSFFSNRFQHIFNLLGLRATNLNLKIKIGPKKVKTRSSNFPIIKLYSKWLIQNQ